MGTARPADRGGTQLELARPRRGGGVWERSAVEAQAVEDRAYHLRARQRCDDLHLATAVSAAQHLEAEDATQLCTRCGSRMKIIAYLTDPPVVEGILESLALPTMRRP